MRQHKLDRVIVDLFDFLDQRREGISSELRPCTLIVVGIVLVPLTVEREDHIVCIEFTRRSEKTRGVKLHALSQVKRIFLAVGRNVPAFREAGFQFRRAALDLDKSVGHIARRRIIHGAGCRLRRIEHFRRCLGAIDQRLGKDLSDRRAVERSRDQRG